MNDVLLNGRYIVEINAKTGIHSFIVNIKLVIFKNNNYLLRFLILLIKFQKYNHKITDCNFNGNQRLCSRIKFF